MAKNATTTTPKLPVPPSYADTQWVKFVGHSVVWKNFFKHKTLKMAKCMECGKEISIGSGSTTGLAKHWSARHPLANDPVEEPAAPAAVVSIGIGSSSSVPKKRQFSMDNFTVVKDAYTRNELIARLAAQDNVSFYRLAHSDRFKYLFKGRNLDLPNSHTTVRNIVVLTEGKRVKDIIKAEISNLKSENQKFSLTMDEWTSGKNRRYMNINLHCKDDQVIVCICLACLSLYCQRKKTRQAHTQTLISLIGRLILYKLCYTKHDTNHHITHGFHPFKKTNSGVQPRFGPNDWIVSRRALLPTRVGPSFDI
jgi:hypothetical protein